MDHENQGTQDSEAQAEATVETKIKPKKAGGDLIADTAVEVAALTKTKALNMAANLAENIEANYFKLGGVLKIISDNGWFEGYESFDVFVFEKFGFQARKARYLMQIYVDLVNKQIPWEKVAHLGWTKIKDLAPILTLENLDEWVAKAENVTVLELQAMLKAKSETGGTEKTTDDFVKLKFNVKQDQAETIQHALAKAKGEVGTEFDTVALENICALYLGGNMGTIPSTGADIESVMSAIGWEASIQAFGKLFPQIDISVSVPE
jgi:hypothetical protein